VLDNQSAARRKNNLILHDFCFSPILVSQLPATTSERLQTVKRRSGEKQIIWATRQRSAPMELVQHRSAGVLKK
jgi:hypothetical protein